MTRYQVEFSVEAVADLDKSFEWGCERWGRIEAATWYLETRNSINQVLGTLPLANAIAPENAEYDVEVRHMSFGRYRVIYNVTGRTVTILHILGPYSGR